MRVLFSLPVKNCNAVLLVDCRCARSNICTQNKKLTKNVIVTYML